MGNSDSSNSHLQELQKIKEQIAKMEAQFATSWALQTKEDFDKNFKENMKDYINSHINKFLISAMIIMTGAGYFFIKSAISGAIMDKSASLIKEFKAEHYKNINDENRLFGWQRFHNYGKNYVYLAELYYNSYIQDSLKQAKITESLSKAAIYFTYALDQDPKQASTYWELGEIYYSHSRKLGAINIFDRKKAANLYTQCAEFYSMEEIDKGWRGDPYRQLGKIFFEIGETQKKGKAESYLLKAQEEYKKAKAESYGYNKEYIEEVRGLLNKISPQME